MRGGKKIGKPLLLLGFALLWVVVKPVQGYCSADTIPIFVSIAPQAYLVKEIGGHYVSVQTLIPPGQEPHGFAPTPKQIVSLGRARVYFKIGMPFEESLLAKIKYNNNTLSIIDMSENVAFRAIEEDNHHDNRPSHGEHRDPHIWFGIPQVKQMAVNVVTSLKKLDPSHSGYYGEHYQILVDRIEAVYQKARKQLEPFAGQALYVFHPAFGYFADTFGLVQRPVETGGKSPSPLSLTGAQDNSRFILSATRSVKVSRSFPSPGTGS